MRSSGNSFDAEYLIHPYSVSWARFVSSEWKFQVETCLTGGGDVRNDWRQNYNGSSSFVEETVDRRVGYTWGTNSKFQNGAITSTLNFKVDAGPVEIGASTTVTFTDTYSGTAGADGYMTSWPYSNVYDGNRVNAYYKGGRDWIWQGSPDFQGNNAHALYEWPMTYSEDIYIGGWRQISAHCGRLGNDCAPFN
jgi:hypothetical protein